MDTKEIGVLVRALTKASQNNEPASNLMAIMQKLKDGVMPTEELLRVRGPPLSHRLCVAWLTLR